MADSDVELTRFFGQDEFAAALSAWEWIDLEGLEPWFASAFGDVFLVGEDGVYWLDIWEGDLTLTFDSVEEARQEMSTEDGLDEYLLAGLAFAAHDAGLAPGEGQVLAFKESPALDGEFEVANIEVARFIDVAIKAGRLHEQLAEAPDDSDDPDDFDDPDDPDGSADD